MPITQWREVMELSERLGIDISIEFLGTAENPKAFARFGFDGDLWIPIKGEYDQDSIDNLIADILTQYELFCKNRKEA